MHATTQQQQQPPPPPPAASTRTTTTPADTVHDKSSNKSSAADSDSRVDMAELVAAVRQLYSGPDPASLIYSADMPLVAAATLAAHTTTTTQHQQQPLPYTAMTAAQHIAAVMSRLDALAEPTAQSCMTPRVVLYALTDILRHGLLLAMPADMLSLQQQQQHSVLPSSSSSATQQQQQQWQHDATRLRSPAHTTVTTTALAAATTPTAALPYSSAALAAVTTSPSLSLLPQQQQQQQQYNSNSSGSATAMTSAHSTATPTATAATAAAVSYARAFHTQTTARRVPAVAMVRGLHTLTYVSTKLRVELVLAQLQQRLRDALAAHKKTSNSSSSSEGTSSDADNSGSGSSSSAATTTTAADAQHTEALAALLVTQILVDDMAKLYARLVLAVPLLHSIVAAAAATTTTTTTTRPAHAGKALDDAQRLQLQLHEAANIAVPTLTRYYYELTDLLALVESTARAPAVSYTRVTHMSYSDGHGCVLVRLQRPSLDTPWGLLLNERGRVLDIDVAMRVHPLARTLHAMLRSTATHGAYIIEINNKLVHRRLVLLQRRPLHTRDEAGNAAVTAGKKPRKNTPAPSVAHVLAAAAAGRLTLTLKLRSDAMKAISRLQPVQVAFFALPAQGGEGGVGGQRAALLLQRHDVSIPWPFVIEQNLMWRAGQMNLQSVLSRRALEFVRPNIQRLRLLAVNGVEVRNDVHARVLLARTETALLEFVIHMSPYALLMMKRREAALLGISRTRGKGVPARYTAIGPDGGVGAGGAAGGTGLVPVTSAAADAAATVVADKLHNAPQKRRMASLSSILRKGGSNDASTTQATSSSGALDADTAAAINVKKVSAAATNNTEVLWLRNDISMRALDWHTVTLERQSTMLPWGISVEQYAQDNKGGTQTGDGSDTTLQQQQDGTTGSAAATTAAEEHLPLRLLSLPSPIARTAPTRRRRQQITASTADNVTEQTAHALMYELTHKPSSLWIAEVNGMKATNPTEVLKYIAKQKKLTLRFVRK